MGTDHGKAWKRGNSEHPPAIELHVGNRYFAVTHDRHPDSPETIGQVDRTALLRLIRETGPAFAAPVKNPMSEPLAVRSGSPALAQRIGAAAAQHPFLARRWGGDWEGLQDSSRSGRAMALGSALKGAGFSFDDVRAALLAHPDTAEWARTKGEASHGRELRRAFDAAGEGARHAAPSDAKRPLTREIAPAPIFPGDALLALRTAAEGVQEVTRVPFAIAAQSVLAAAALAVQPHRDVELPSCGARPLTGLFVTIAGSGERKTACDRLALRAVYRCEERLREQHGPEMAAHLADREAWKAAAEHVRKLGKGNRAAIREALAANGPEPKPPPLPMLLVSDPTPEALVLHLQNGRPWCGLFTDEGGTLVGGHAMNDDNRMRTGALLNSLWDGAPIRRLRVGSGASFLPGRRCSAHVMMQPHVAGLFFGDATLAGIGVLARCLTVAPESAAGTREYREPTIAAHNALAHHDAILAALLARAPETAAGEPDVLKPPVLRLHPDAGEVWIAFHDATERDLANDRPLAPIRAFASKLPEHAGRLAAMLTVYADPDAMEVSRAAMQAGIALAEHYAAELLRLGEAAAVAPDLALAQRLLAWWQARPDPRCHLAGIYQRGLNAIADAATARRIVTILEEHGHVTRLPSGTFLDGTAKRDCWELVP